MASVIHSLYMRALIIRWRDPETAAKILRMLIHAEESRLNVVA